MAKVIQIAGEANYGFMIWYAESSGTALQHYGVVGKGKKGFWYMWAPSGTL
jgi:hypothetical protein